MRKHRGRLLEVMATFISVRSALLACALVGSAWTQIAFATEAPEPFVEPARTTTVALLPSCANLVLVLTRSPSGRAWTGSDFRNSLLREKSCDF
jgi:hypothetical protein